MRDQTRPAGRRGRAALGIALLAVASGTILGAGCASRPAPLPAVRPETMPDAWIDLLIAAPCPATLEARVAMRVDAPDQPGVNLDGTLKFAGSGASGEDGLLKLDARLGVFRPIFNLIAKGESAQLLIHEERATWVTPRDEPDWDGMNPSAWAAAVGWALCPAALLRELEPEGAGRVQGDTWSVQGRLPSGSNRPGTSGDGDGLRVEIRVDRTDRSVEAIRLEGAAGAAVTASLESYRYFGDAWIPTVVHLSLPQPEGRLELRAILKGVHTPDPEVLDRIEILEPPGWIQVTEPMALPIPTESGADPTP